MKPWIAVAIFVLCAAGSARAQQQDLAAAQTLLLKGRYDEAADRFAAAVDSDPAAAIGLARCRLSVGKNEEAEAAVKAAAERFPQSAAIQAELALLALRRGDHEAAGRYKSASLALDKDHVPARWVEAELL